MAAAAKKAAQGLPGTSLAIVGPRGAGKTIAVARLGQLLGGFDEEPLQECRALAKDLGRPYCGHAWMLDQLAEEREAGSTVEPSLLTFASDAFCYTAVDTPGCAALARTALGAASLADAAVLVVSAAAGEFEADLDSGRAREIALGCFVMGVKNIVVWVTKMDDISVQSPATRFEDIKKSVSAFLKEVGYKQKDVPFVPISGLLGDNLVSRSAEMAAWYSGPTAVEALDALGPINRPAEKPLRLPVLEVHEIAGTGTVVVGRVETGTLRLGIKVILSPGGLVSEVRSIQRAGERVSEAKGGDVVGVGLGAAAGAIRRGMVLSFATNDPAADAETFIAQVVVLDHPGVIRAGYCPAITIHTAQVPCEFEELLSKTDRKTGKESEANPESVRTGEVVTVKLRPRAPVCVEPFSAYPSLGRFAIRDHGRTIAVGVVKEVTKRSIPKARSVAENQYFDSS